MAKQKIIAFKYSDKNKIEEAQKLLSNGYFIPLRKEIDSEVVGEIVDSLLENL